MMAVQGLGEVREARAAARLRELMLAPATEPVLRLEAARSLALVRTKGSEGDAKRLLAEAGPAAPLTRLAAASLLRYHRGGEATDLMKRLATDADPAANHYVLGPGADPVPTGLIDYGYGAEARWNVNGSFTCKDPTTNTFVTGPLKAGHTYRMQFMIHDGDQNKSGGDVGQACAVVAVP